jgi:TolB protein
MLVLASVVVLAYGPSAAAALNREDGAQLMVASTGHTSAQNPAFSPDGATLMFTRYAHGYDGNGGGVFQAPSEGGPVSPLWGRDGATNVNGLASWNGASNRVAFAIYSGNGDIATVAASGDPRTYVQLTHAGPNRSYLEPTYSPDGQSIAFEEDQPNAASEDGQAGSLYVMSASGGAVTALVTGGDNRLPVWSPDGKLILFQRRTDLRSDYHLFTIDRVSKVMTQVTGLAGTATAGNNCDSDASWSPDGKWILDSACYGQTPPCPTRPNHTESNIFLVSADGNQVIRVTRSPSEEDGAPAMSPDGRWIYFESHRKPCRDHSPAQIWRIASPVKLASRASRSSAARSDGSMLVFAPTKSSPVRARKPSAQNPCYVSSSQLLFTLFTSGYNNPANTGSAGLFATPAAGGAPSELVFHREQSAVNEPGTCYSAAAGRIAYSSDLESAFSNTDNVWTSLPGALSDSEHEVTCYQAPLHAQEPSWSPDGKTLVYELDNDRAPNATSIWTIPASNNCETPLAPTRIYPCATCAVSGANHEPNWSPNGGEIVFQHQARPPNGAINLWMVRPNGSEPMAITTDPNSDTDASWSPDGSAIVYSTDFQAPTGVANLFIVTATAGGAKTRLTSQCFYDGAPSWSPDGAWVSFETWANPHKSNRDFPTAIWRIPASARPAAPSC